jgi:hypothetical protein
MNVILDPGTRCGCGVLAQLYTENSGLGNFTLTIPVLICRGCDWSIRLYSAFCGSHAQPNTPTHAEASGTARGRRPAGPRVVLSDWKHQGLRVL